MHRISRRFPIFCGLVLLAFPALAQMPPGGPPAVGVVVVQETEVTEATRFNGRIEATDRVAVVARVSAYLDERLFTEGADVEKGKLLFRLEQAPYRADVEAKEAAVAQAQAQLDNAEIAHDRAFQLRKSGSGSQSSLDDAIAARKTATAQLRSVEAALHVAQINLGYTEIRSPIDGRIGRASVTAGNVVSPSSGTLATVVSQDPMRVTFSVPTRSLIELQQKSAAEGGAGKALRIRLRLPDGRLYSETGRLDFVDVGVAADTDSVTLRGTIANPADADGRRELFNDEFVRVILELVTPKTALAIPRAAVLKDQQGNFVWVVGDGDVAKARRLVLGQSTASTAVVVEGLSVGERIVVEGVQRVRPNAPVAPQILPPETATQG